MSGSVAFTVSALAVASAVLLSACSSSSNNNSATDPAAPSVSQVFANSNFVNEQFATITSRNRRPVSTPDAVDAVVSGFNEFALDIHRSLSSADPASNTIVSGYSLSTALALAMAGTANESRAAMATLLRLDAIEPYILNDAINAVDLALEAKANDKLKLRTASRLFVKSGESFLPEFLDTAVADYGAPVTEADFKDHNAEVIAAINQWAAEQTDGLIDKLIDEIDPETLVSILNAILLDANWEPQFDDDGIGMFTNIDQQGVDVPVFSGTGPMPILLEPGMTVVELLYSGSDISMLVLMPVDLETYEQAFDPQELDRVIGRLSLAEVSYTMPKWESNNTIDGKTLLVPLGLPTGPLDFSAMIENTDRSIEITRILQKARIQVDENGTLAAAVTIVDVGVTSAPDEPVGVTIDNPFLYIIRDRETDLILFSGRVVNLG